MRHAVAAGFVLTVAMITAAHAHAGQTAASVETRLAPGLVWHGAIFGDDNPKTTGGLRPTIAVLVRGRPERLFGFSFEAMLEPLGVANPHFDERLHSLQLHAGAEIGRRAIVRPSVGIGVQVWSGSSAETGLGLAPAVGIAVGHRRAEAVARASYSHGAFS